MIQGFYKVLSIAALVPAIALFSCAPYPSGIDERSKRQAGQNPVYDMARPRGVNTDIMLDRNLADLVDEAHVIQAQIDVLVARLQSLRSRIYAHDTVSADSFAPAAETPVSLMPMVSPAAAPAAVAPAPVVDVTSKPKPRAPKPQIATAKGEGVVGVRVGRHADKTRIVFDVNGSTRHTFDFDAQAGVLTVTLPETVWATAQAKTFSFPQLSGYQAKQAEQGTIIAMSVDDTASVKTDTIRATLGKPARLIIDLMK